MTLTTPTLGLVASNTTPTPEFVLFSGTGAPPIGLPTYYRRLTRVMHQAGHITHVRNIYRMGIGRLDKAEEKHAKAFFSPEDNRRYVLAGQSQGCLIAAGLAVRYPERVDALELFAPPWYGTWLAPTWVPIPAVRTMSRQSRWLEDLRLHPKLDPERIHCYFTVLDPLVIPYSSSFIPGAHNHLLVPERLEGLVRQLNARLFRERHVEIEILHGVADHVWIVNHPAVVRSVAQRYPVRPRGHLLAA